MFIGLAFLKIIGIVLLVLLCVIAAFLLVPVSYEMELDIDNRRCDVRVNCFFRLIRFCIHYQESISAVISILFFKYDFLDSEAKEKRKKKKEKKARKRAEKQKKKRKKKADKRKKQRNQDTGLIKNYDPPTAAEPDKEWKGSEELSGNSEDTAQTQNPDSKIKDSFEKMSDYAKSARRMCNLVKEYGIIGIVWPGLQTFLIRIRPRILKGCISFGMEDPSLTGKITGALAMVPFFYQTELQISPDFETDVFYIKGNLYTKGYIFLIHLVILIMGMVREKKIRQFINVMRNGK